ncbi:MAG: DUF2249 domain-containing protein [Tepidiformaceae bacterium]
MTGDSSIRVEVDNRGLEPPEPMVRILNALRDLQPEGELVALMDREPMLLYPELERRGCVWEFVEDTDHFVLTIRRETP